MSYRLVIIQSGRYIEHIEDRSLRMGCDELPSVWAPTMNVRDSESFDDVMQAELREIALRRSVHQKPNDSQENSESPENLVGLALSGGGLRSASISLGFLQALYDEGVLKKVDYLSTVSGGGYAGALLTSSLEATPKVNWEPGTHAHGSRVLPFSKHCQANSESKPPKPANQHESATPSGSASDPNLHPSLQQPPLVQRIGNKAGSTFGVLGFVSRQIYGLLVTNLFVLSAIGFVVALLAWAFRWIDEPMRAITLSVWGFNSDELRAFVPTLVIGSLWTASMIFSSFWRRSGRTFPPISSFLCAATAVSAAMSILMLLSNGNNDFGARRLGLGVPDSTYDYIRTWIRNIGYGLLAAIAATMSPILAFSRIIQSGAAPQRPLHRKIFNVVSWSVLLGAPIALFYFCVREDVSHYTRLRPFHNEICRGHIRDWDRFVSFVLAGKEDSSGIGRPEHAIRHALFKSLDASAKLEKTSAIELLNQCQIAQSAVSRSTREYKTISRFALCLLEPTLGSEVPQRIRDELITYSERRDTICRMLNDRYLTDSEISDLEQLVSKKVNDQQFRKDDTERDRAIQASSSIDKLRSLNVQVKRILDEVIPSRRKYANTITTQELPDAQRLVLFQAYDELMDPRSEYTREVTQWWNETGQSFTGIYQDKPTDAKSGPLDKKKEADAKPSDGQYLREISRMILASEEQLQAETTSDSIESLRHAQNAKREIFDLLNEIQKHRWNLTVNYLCEELVGSDLVYPVDTVFATIVQDKDQHERLGWAKMCLLLALFFGLLSSLNHTSMHAYYAECLGQLWIVHHPEHGVQIPLRRLASCERGGPLHLINGTLNLYGSSQLAEKDRIGRFTLSKTHCGARRVAYKPTAEYMQGSTDLASAVAISGGAVSPVAIDNVLVRVLLTLANCRLGKWVHHPERPPYDVSWPSPLYLLWQYISSQPEDRRYLFVSDGGHNENTGISALLERRCRLIIALDGGHDQDGQFTDMYHLLREARDQHGIQITERRMKTAEDFHFMRYDQTNRHSKQHFTVFDVVYPSAESGEPQTGVLIYVKSTLTGDEGHEITSELASSKEFPHDVTADLFFSSQRFHSYRALGEHLGLSVLNHNDILEDEEIRGLLRLPKPTPPLSQTETAPQDRTDSEVAHQDQPEEQLEPRQPMESEVEQFIAELLTSKEPAILLRKLGLKRSPFRSVLEAIDEWENKVGPVGFNLFKVLSDNPRTPGLKKLREYLAEYLGEGDQPSEETKSPSKELS